MLIYAQRLTLSYYNFHILEEISTSLKTGIHGKFLWKELFLC